MTRRLYSAMLIVLGGVALSSTDSVAGGWNFGVLQLRSFAASQTMIEAARAAGGRGGAARAAGGRGGAAVGPRGGAAVGGSRAVAGPRGAAAVRGGAVAGPRGNVAAGRSVAVVRPVRPWVRRPYYGTVVAGVTLGTIIAATAVAVAPPAPASNLCWYWSDGAKTRGYWDYCGQ